MYVHIDLGHDKWASCIRRHRSITRALTVVGMYSRYIEHDAGLSGSQKVASLTSQKDLIGRCGTTSSTMLAYAWTTRVSSSQPYHAVR